MKKSTTKTISSLRWVARILSALLIAFFLFMFIGESWDAISKGHFFKPLSYYDLFRLSLMFTGIIGLGIAWKWELIGGIIGSASFFILCALQPGLFLSPIIIFLLTAGLFIVVWILESKLKRSESY